MTCRSNWQSEMNVARLRESEALLRQQPMTTEQLAVHLGLSATTTGFAIAHLDKRIHIADWHITGPFKGAAMHAWGEAPNAPYPYGVPWKKEVEAPAHHDSRVARRDHTVAMFFGEART